MTDTNITTTVAGFTDTGMVRTNNEDNFLIADLSTGRVFLIPQRISHKSEENRLLLAVSDGVGGASSGEIASSMAVHSMRVELLRRNNTSVSPFDRLVQAVEKANSLIWAEGQANPERRGMGATITAALIEKNVAYIAEVGDSRGYVIRSGRIKQLTTDQSLVGILVNRGLMTPQQAETAPGRNIILQSLGCQAEVKVAVTSLELTTGDYLLLCSDGLTGKIKDEELLTFVSNNSSVEDACRQMIEVAKQRGGEDNITVVLAKFEGDALRHAEPVPRLTTHIEVLAAFDPEDEAHQRAKREAKSKESLKIKGEASKTKRLSSERGKGPTVHTHTLGGGGLKAKKLAELTTERVQMEKYSRQQLLDQNNETEACISATIAALKKQIDYFQHMLYWAERENRNTAHATASIKKLEQFLNQLKAQKLSLEDANKVAEQLS